MYVYVNQVQEPEEISDTTLTFLKATDSDSASTLLDQAMATDSDSASTLLDQAIPEELPSRKRAAPNQAICIKALPCLRKTTGSKKRRRVKRVQGRKEKGTERSPSVPKLTSNASAARNIAFRSKLRSPGGLLMNTRTLLDGNVALPPDLSLDHVNGPALHNAFKLIRDFLETDRTLIGDPDTPRLGKKNILAASDAMARRLETDGFLGIVQVDEWLPVLENRPLTPTRFGYVEFPPIVGREESQNLKKKYHPSAIISSVALNREQVHWADPRPGFDPHLADRMSPELRDALDLFSADAMKIGDRLSAVFGLETEVELLAAQFNEQRDFFPAHQDSTAGAIVEDEATGELSVVGGDGPGDLIATRTLAGRATIGLEKVDETLESGAGGSVLVDLRNCEAAFEQRTGDVYALVRGALDNYVHCIDPSIPDPEDFKVWGPNGSPSEGSLRGQRDSVTYRFVWRIGSSGHIAGKLHGKISDLEEKEWSRGQGTAVVSNSHALNSLQRYLDARTLWKAVKGTKGLKIMEGDLGDSVT